MADHLSEDEFYAALTGDSATLGWDVLVSYTAKELNTLLKSQWAASGTSQVVIDKPNLKHHFSTHYDLTLGAPTLQFNTDRSGSANLVCTLDGTYRDDDIDSTGKVIKVGSPVSTLKSGAYVVNINVPISAIHVDGTTTTEHPPGVVEFPGDKETANYLTFNFKNVEQTVFKVEKVPGTPKYDEDDDVADLGGHNGPISNWFGNVDNVKSITVAIAQITNTKPSGDDAKVITDVLQPKSFIFATQSNSDGGLLLIFMQTVGSGRAQGNPSPTFRAPKQLTKDVAAVPFGYHAAIIINHDLFSDAFLKKQLAAKLGTSVSVEATTEGFKLKCPIKQAQKQFQDYAGEIGPFGFAMDGITIDLETDPVMELTLRKEVQITPTFMGGPIPGTTGQKTPPVPLMATWALEKWGSLDWSYTGFQTTDKGSVNIVIKANQTQKDCFAISDNKINAQLKLTSDAFSTDVTYKDGGGGWGRDVPDRIKSAKFKFNDISMTFPELSFFATQNVFAPGKQAIISKKFMGPYDFIVLGDIVEPVKPAMRRAVMHALKPDTGHNSTQLFKRDAVPAAASQTDKQRMKAMMDDFHEDDFGFAKDVVAAISAGDEDAYKACFSSRNYDIGKADPSCLTGLTTPGPDFDIRYCAGVYRLETSSDAHDPGKVLYVDALQRTIWIDNAVVSEQKIDADGTITFSTSSSKFSVKFDGTFTKEGDPVDHHFAGKLSSAADPSASVDVKATRFFTYKPKPKASRLMMRQLAANDPAASLAWYEEPGYLNFMGVMGIMGYVPFTFQMLNFAWTHGKPVLVNIGQKVGLLKAATQEQVLKRIQAQVTKAKIDLSDVGARIESEARKAAMDATAGKDISDAGAKAGVVKDLKVEIRALITKDLNTHLKAGVVANNVGAVPLGVDPGFWKDGIDKALQSKFNDIMGPDQWDDYVDALVERGDAEKRAFSTIDALGTINTALKTLETEKKARDLKFTSDQDKLNKLKPQTGGDEKQRAIDIADVERDIADAQTADGAAAKAKAEHEQKKTDLEAERQKQQNEWPDKEKTYKEKQAEAFHPPK